MSSLTRIRPKCSVRGCPRPFDEDWHHCVAAGESWHTCNGTASHQHVPRRNHPGSRIVVCLDLNLHVAIDQSFPHTGPDGVKRRIENVVVDGEYRIKERGPSGKILFRIPVEVPL